MRDAPDFGELMSGERAWDVEVKETPGWTHAGTRCCDSVGWLFDRDLAMGAEEAWSWEEEGVAGGAREHNGRGDGVERWPHQKKENAHILIFISFTPTHAPACSVHHSPAFVLSFTRSLAPAS